jgi:hypothetical protein
MSFLFIARRKSDGSCRASPVAVVSSWGEGDITVASNHGV